MMEKRLSAIGDGCRLAWCFDGPVDAPVLLLSNSLGTTMEMWAPQIAVWARRPDLQAAQSLIDASNPLSW